MGPINAEELALCHLDFDHFVSRYINEDFIYHDPVILDSLRELWATSSSFSNLTSLTTFIGSASHLLLLLEPGCISSVTELTVYGKRVDVTDTHITLLRLAITRFDKLHSISSLIDPDVPLSFIDSENDYRSHGVCQAPFFLRYTRPHIPDTLAFLFDGRQLKDSNRERIWPPLSQRELEAWGSSRTGPRLNVLDLSELSMSIYT